MGEKKLGLGSVVSVSVGLVITTSCLVSLGQGAGEIGELFIIAMIIACVMNIISMATMAELNALMPNITGGLAQYTLAGMGPVPTIVLMIGGYLIASILSTGVEASIFAYSMGQILHLPVPNLFWTILATVIILIANLRGVDMFAKVQTLVSFLMLGIMLLIGILGTLKLGVSPVVHQPAVMNGSFSNIMAMTATAFWLFIGAEYAIPISKEVKNARRNVPLGMFIGLGLICVIQSVMVLGFHNYTTWHDLTTSAAPHLLYGTALLGYPGQILIVIISALAVVSTQNSTVQGLSEIFAGMSKLNLVPQIFGKTSKRNVPIFGVWFVSATIFLCAYISQDSSDRISFLILVGSVFWMASYICAHIDLLIFRHRLPKAPRTFKVPGGPILPLIGIAGTAYMVLNISTDPTERNMIWLVTGVIFLVLFVYSVFWVKFKMKIPVFKAVPMEKVMAMENTMYYQIRKNRGIWR